jgi:hypothetical protein
MDENILKDIVEEIEDFQKTSARCRDLQKVILYCQENYDFWKEIKLGYLFSFYKNRSISVDITSFDFDQKNRVLLLSNDDTNNKIMTIFDLDKLINYLKNDDPNWGNILIVCDSCYSPSSCYFDENQNKICFVS